MVLEEVLILIAFESARRERSPGYALAKTLASFCGEQLGIPAGCKLADEILL